MKVCILHILRQSIFPERCVSCRVRGQIFCKSCQSTLKLNTAFIDPDTVAFFAYKQRAIKKSLWLLKYRSKIKVAAILASLMCDNMEELLVDKVQFDNFTHPLIIPIPMSTKARRKRGFNQAEAIAVYIQKHLSLGCDIDTSSLVKTRETPRQATFRDRKARLKNLASAYQVTRNESVKNRNIILIDDVTTTGATFAEAKRVLYKAGARSVLCIALAH